VKYEYNCLLCGKTFEKLLPIKDRDNVSCCGQKSERTVVNEFQTDDDLMYQFDASYFGDKPVNIHSRRQYKNLLKQHGYVDATAKECLSVKPKNDTKQKSKKKAEKVMRQMMKENLNQHLKPCFEKHLVKKEVHNGRPSKQS